MKRKKPTLIVKIQGSFAIAVDSQGTRYRVKLKPGMKVGDRLMVDWKKNYYRIVS